VSDQQWSLSHHPIPYKTIVSAFIGRGTLGYLFSDFHFDQKNMVFIPDTVIVHPLVLLSIVDHYNRVAKGTKNRVVGVLLGEVWQGRVDVTNSFAGMWVVLFESGLEFGFS
jgi:hypothetical protein